MPVAPSKLVQWLRAAGEPTRLRLLALCTHAALTVSDLARGVNQSEARVSRHLRILCDAGLCQRVRQGQWVQYRGAEAAEAAGFVRGLLAQIDRRDPQLLRDSAAARAAAAGSATHGGGLLLSESRLGRTLAAFATATGLIPPLDAVLLAGIAHPELLESAARAAKQCTVLVGSRRSAQAARAFVAQRGVACLVRQGADPTDAGPLFDAVLLDHPEPGGEALGALLGRAAGVLAPGGRLWIFERYEALEGSRERVVEHPLARLRRLLGAAGLACERLSPIEADGEHVLAALARPANTAQLPKQAGGIPR